MKVKFYPLYFAILLFSQRAFTQNLIVNPSGEFPATTGWTIVSKGGDCYNSSDWHIQGNQNGFPTAHGGNYFFFSGCNSVNGEIYQDIDVTSYSGLIDAGSLNFTFSGYVQVYNQSPADGALMKVEYFNGSNSLVGIYNTGVTKNVGVWTQYISTITAMPGTRRVRVTLKSYSNNGSSVDAYFDDLSLIGYQLLPLKLTSFTTTINSSNTVTASWKTANEVNNDRFELQRSNDGEIWETVATVQASKGGGVTHSYTANDNLASTGVYFYRLAQYDVDGKMSLSKINTVKLGANHTSLVAYPNPVASVMTVEGDANTLSQLTIFAANGQQVTSALQKSSNGFNSLKIDVSRLPSGIYYIRANGMSRTFYKK